MFLIFFEIALLLSTISPLLSAHAHTNDAPYVKKLDSATTIAPLITVGESIPRTSNPSQSYRFIGIPDGLGLYRDKNGKIHLFVNHELKKEDTSQPVVGQPLVTGAFVSEFLLSSDGKILSGDLAATTILDSETRQPIPGSMSRLCSGFLAGPHSGFDRFVYLTGEEATGDKTLDQRGGLGFAFTEGIAFALPDLGRYRKENLIVLPNTGLKTFIIGLEDGPKGLHSELYLYVGTKNLSSTDPLLRNGLTGGQLYVFGSTNGNKPDESRFTKIDTPLKGRWIPIPDAKHLTDEELDKKTTELGAFRFDRIEDGTYDRKKAGVFYFVSTGGDIPENRMGRLYQLSFDPNDPLRGALLLEILFAGDAGDGIVNPDNVDINANGELLIQENFTAENYFLLLKRNPSIWSYHPGSGQKPTRIAEVDGKLWESSGIIDASEIFGAGSWLLNVQAHTISSRKASALQKINGDAYVVEGGQLLLLKRNLSATDNHP